MPTSEGHGKTVCPFCEIVSGRRSAEIVYENAHVLAFLDQFKQPLIGAHVLIVTRPHVS